MPLTLQDAANARDARGFVDLVVVTPGAGDLPFVPAGIMVSADCTVTMTFASTNSVALPLKAGVQYLLHPVKITAVSTGTCWIAPALAGTAS